METLFSTITQVSFTVVGMFFLALTVDSDSKDFWLGDKTLNKYVTINFFILLLPGLISIAWLIPFSLVYVPAWAVISLMLLIGYLFVYWELRKFYKTKVYQRIEQFESAVDAKGSLTFGIAGLVCIFIYGVVLSVTRQEASEFVLGVLGVFLFFLTFVSVIPVYVFLRKGAETKIENETLKKVGEAATAHHPADQSSSNNTGVQYLYVLVGLLFSFLVGFIIRKD